LEMKSRELFAPADLPISTFQVARITGCGPPVPRYIYLFDKILSFK
jgi:hypothetical protein